MARMRSILMVALGVGVAAGLFGLGRVTAADPAAARAEGQETGYTTGFRAGLAQGVGEGRALQEGAAVPADARDAATTAFAAGYTAGKNDTFGGYDGGWSLGTPYVVTLNAGTAGVTYRIASRSALRAGVNYYVCEASPSICEEARP